MKVAIIGTGLIGGSVGLTVLRADPTHVVAGFDADPAASAAALERGAVSSVAGSAADAVRGADVVVIATPVGATASVAASIAGSVPAGAIVTDAGSTKSRIVAEVEGLLSPGVYVGGHPMAGSEADGVGAARADLFWGALWILTPTERTDPSVVSRMEDFVTTLGARPVILSPEDHDRTMAVVSHLPQLVATSLMNLAAEAQAQREGLLTLAAGGFRDTTRLAASSPDIWVDICRDNSAALADAVLDLASRLSGLGEALRAGEIGPIEAALRSGRAARRALPEKTGARDLYEVRLAVPDRAGVLAEVTVALGAEGINIEDLRISHVVEGARGVIHVVVTGRAEAERAAAILATKRYEAEVIQL